MEQNTYATITTYNFPTTPQLKIKVTKKQDGTVWFAVEDISHATGIDPVQILDGIDPAHLAAFVTYVFKDNRGTVEIDMISFARLRLVIARSNMVRARAFFQWVENEIMGIKENQEDLVKLTDTIVPGGSRLTFRTSHLNIQRIMGFEPLSWKLEGYDQDVEILSVPGGCLYRIGDYTKDALIHSNFVFVPFCQEVTR